LKEGVVDWWRFGFNLTKMGFTILFEWIQIIDCAIGINTADIGENIACIEKEKSAQAHRSSKGWACARE
jgi:hypothetical protein